MTTVMPIRPRSDVEDPRPGKRPRGDGQQGEDEAAGDDDETEDEENGDVAMQDEPVQEEHPPDASFGRQGR